ncbi:Rieske 2Fe-2S domain-containing protein [Gallaecimonas kandeliae]|uniref:Rieske (2Fe-2S) protein n=1 Tax=Gallaecimonas kandeliae TaxID=3029055 RepID=UPI0026494F45|nr:Rieske 2Fe-2S domain-containing protein [Gallaecimonas kandeliae]WKE65864.1 Rieske 2Fe-2S domain-containing protein [Gallaecimonas kandeliae]
MSKPEPFRRLKAGHRLCVLADLKDPGSKSFYFESPGGELLSIFLVRRGHDIKGYVNRCPHMGVPLGRVPDSLLTLDGRQILCDKHGALFDIDTGLCTVGPCRYAYLQPVPVRLQGDEILTA